jgi:hypothetical protein
MPHTFSKIVALGSDDAVRAAADVLWRHKFSVLTEIDDQPTLEKRLGVDFKPRRIHGACNQEMTRKALRARGGCRGESSEIRLRNKITYADRPDLGVFSNSFAQIVLPLPPIHQLRPSGHVGHLL